MSASPFHIGEQRAQARTGSQDHVNSYAREMIRHYMPDQHREFFAQLPFLVVTARGEDGHPWTTILSGSPGFVSSPDDQTLLIAAMVPETDPLRGLIESGAPVGLLGIELDSRRRNRANGQFLSISDGVLRFRVRQSFGNCPQYITQRQWYSAHTATPPAVFHTDSLTDEQISWVKRADTFFIGSGYDSGDDGDEANGMDASHRGGPAGFVAVRDKNALVFPDYAGNRHFNTLGNLLEDSRVCLLIPDFSAGHLLQIAGRACIDWDSSEVAAIPGAQRLINVEIDQVVEQHHVLPIRWRSLRDAQIKLKVVQRVEETPTTTSFVLGSADGSSLPDFSAGQYLPIVIASPGSNHHVERTYSLSGAPADLNYRISVQRQPEGYVSQHLHDRLRTGDELYANHPAGEFTVEPGTRPLVLVSAGIGVTPMMSMLAEQVQLHSKRSVLFVHGARNSQTQAFAEERAQWLARLPNSQSRIVFSKPSTTDLPGQDFDRQGRVNVADLEALLPDLNGVFYLCGPAAFVGDVLTGLKDRGVPDSDLFHESFG